MKSLRKSLVALSLVVASGVAAQPAGKTKPAPMKADKTDKTDKTDKMPEGEELERKLADLEQQSRQDLRHVQRLRAVARKAKDVVKLNCVNDKLLEIRALLNVIDVDRGRLDSAGLGGAEGRQAAYGDVVKNTSNIRGLKEEANACVGEDLTYSGDSNLDVDGPDLPDDPTVDPFDDGIESPSYKTPFS
ncbi:MAG: hypothetical protein KA249_07800 [Dermatophilaceae bacterium]|jgi:hypothetical protein|nr:hypothetical protein [Dermatophilaceae bacterium]